MKLKSLVFLTVIAALSSAPTAQAGIGFGKESFEKIFYFSGAAGLGSANGSSADNAAAITDGDIMAIEAGMVIETVYVIIDTAVAGSTAIDIGDDDDADGFVKNASLTLGTPGMYGWDAKAAGAYLRVQTAGASDATDIYVVPQAKHYSAAGKEIKLDNTTTNTGGAFRVIVKGFKANL